MTQPLEQWHEQVDAALDDIELARRRREPVTLILRMDCEGSALQAKLTKTIQEAQHTERIQVWPVAKESRVT